MKGKWRHLVALVLVLAVMLSGCSGSFRDMMDRFYNMIQMGMAVPFDEMEYIRPDMAEFRELLDETRELVDSAKDSDELMAAIYDLYLCYYDFATNYQLANIHYCQNMTDIYWEEEYSWCMKNSSEVTAGMDKLLYALADSKFREELEKDEFFGEDFFDLYEGDSLWDETFTALMEQETALVDQYYELNAQALELEYYSEEYFGGIGQEIEEVYVDLIAVRQEIAEYASYESYPEFAYEFYYYRDYTPEQADGYLQQIQQELVPLYQTLSSDVWAPMQEACTQDEVFAYVQQCAAALGGVAKDAFAAMEKLELYDIAYSDDKYDASFEVFLPSYALPFVFMNPMGNQRDQLVFAHEFGHFCNDYAAGGSMVGIDVAEVFSQGLEYLSLSYCENTQALTRMKMADSLCTFVEQAAYASFERQVYALEAEELTVENVRSVYQQINEDFGLDDAGRDVREYTLIPHIFISPMYVISYVVSNDAAMQIYQLELEETGAGAALWEESLFTMQMGYMAFIEEAGLKSPFEEGRVAQIRATLEEKLK